MENKPEDQFGDYLDTKTFLNMILILWGAAAVIFILLLLIRFDQ